jgi:hypothetical protein
MNSPSDCTPAPNPTPPAGHSPRQVVLGLFILFQLVFVVFYNLIGLFQDAQTRLDSRITAVIDRVMPGYGGKSGHAWKISDEISTGMRRWGQLTGQDQSWSLFAPNVAEVTGFPAVVLNWEDVPTSGPALARPLAQLAASSPLEVAALDLAARAPAFGGPPPPEELFLSDNEPPNPHHFFRIGKFRIRRYEGALIPYLSRRKGETEAEANERWAGAIRDHVAEYPDQLQAYVQWRLSVWQKQHPDSPPPRQVILVERTYKILPPDDDTGAIWDGPRTLPLLRWQPQAVWQTGFRAIERYNPVTQRFESIQK